MVISFLPRSKRLLIAWLQSPPAVILEPRKIKSDTVSTVSPSICHEVMGPKNTGVGCHSLSQGIFPTQGLNLGLLPHSRFFTMSHQDANIALIKIILVKTRMCLKKVTEGGVSDFILSL